MVLDLKGVFGGNGVSLPIEHTLDMRDTDFFGNRPLKNPVVTQGRVFNSAGVVTLAVDISYEFTAPCDRCGKEVSRKFVIPFERSLAVSIEAEESDTIITVPDMLHF